MADSAPSNRNGPALFKSIIAGSAAGGLGYFSTVPLDFIKQRLQATHYGDKRQALATSWQTVLRQNPVKTMFSGTLVGCAAIVPQMTIKFAANDYLQRNTQNSAFTNGFLAGYVDGTFLGPILSLQSLKQMRTEMTYREAFSHLLKSSIPALTVPMALRNATYTGLMFGGHGALRPIDRKKQSFLNTVGICSALNLPATIACSPFDVVRAKQIQRMLQEKESVSAVAIARDIYRRNGFRGFYQGYGSLYLNFALRFPLTFGLYQFFSRRMEER